MIGEALVLMAVGMGTVFAVLFITIYFSRLMILLINRFFPEQTPAVVKSAAQSGAEIPAKIVAAISTAVNAATGGKAQVVKIEKSKK